MSEKTGQRLLLQGNEAMVEGALAAGCRFFAGYPITPASEIAELMSLRLPAAGGTFIQMEDEIAGMGAVIGASLAGVKSLTATSGPGFSLMQENLGFACAAEVPCVVVNVMRAGPSTGLSTSPAQGDVMQARWGTHGDHPVIVLAVSTVNDCFTVTVQAFNLAEKYRVPVIVLSDEIVAHTREAVVLPDPAGITVIDRTRPAVPPEWYIPYEDNSRGVPAMAEMGSGYRHHVTGLIHDVRGFPTERPEEVDAFIRRLFRKITNGFAGNPDDQFGHDGGCGNCRDRLRRGVPFRPAGGQAGQKPGDQGRPAAAHHPLSVSQKGGGGGAAAMPPGAGAGNEYGAGDQGGEAGQCCHGDCPA